MLEVYQRLGLHKNAEPTLEIELDHLQRERGRLRVNATNGEEVGLFLERGKTLQVGEKLQSECGKIIVIKGACETVTKAHCHDWQQFARACYHLGNRHVKLQVGERWLRIAPDHVLAEMLQGLGLSVEDEQAVFEPESGAYGQHGGHGHGHSHDHHHPENNLDHAH